MILSLEESKMVEDISEEPILDEHRNVAYDIFEGGVRGNVYEDSGGYSFDGFYKIINVFWESDEKSKAEVCTLRGKTYEIDLARIMRDTRASQDDLDRLMNIAEEDAYREKDKRENPPDDIPF